MNEQKDEEHEGLDEYNTKKRKIEDESSVKRLKKKGKNRN